MKLLIKIISILSVVLIVLQFFRPEKNEGIINGANHISKFVTVPENIEIILKTACYDCHSNNTNYPWYSEIMPLGWWLNQHVNEGKAHLNFSEFGLYTKKKQDHKLEEVFEEVREREMPLKYYTYLHKNAKLTDHEVFLLTQWAEKIRKEVYYNLKTN